MTTWLLIVFISNGWGGGELKEVATFPTEQACKIAGKAMYDEMRRVHSPVCLRVPAKAE